MPQFKHVKARATWKIISNSVDSVLPSFRIRTMRILVNGCGISTTEVSLQPNKFMWSYIHLCWRPTARIVLHVVNCFTCIAQRVNFTCIERPRHEPTVKCLHI